MTNILITTENTGYRHALADALAASGHRVTATTDAVTALAALRLSQRRMVALLGETIRLRELEGQSWLDILASEKIGSPELASKVGDLEHAYIVLTQTSPEELPPTLRALVSYGRAAVLDPNCSLATLVAAVEQAAEHIAQDDSRSAGQEFATHG